MKRGNIDKTGLMVYNSIFMEEKTFLIGRAVITIRRGVKNQETDFRKNNGSLILKLKPVNDESPVETERLTAEKITGPEILRKTLRKTLGKTDCLEAEIFLPESRFFCFPLKDALKCLFEETLFCISGKGRVKKVCFSTEYAEVFESTLEAAEIYLVPLLEKTFRNPVPTVDIIIEKDGGIVLVKRKNYPFGWALPGGFAEYGESLEEAAEREAEEETGLKLKNLEQFHTYSDPGRDPRLHTVSTVFTAAGEGILRAADDAKEARLFTPNGLPESFAFDHAKILEEYLCQRKKGKERKTYQ